MLDKALLILVGSPACRLDLRQEGVSEGEAILQGEGHNIRLMLILAGREGNHIVEHNCFHRP